MIQDVEDIIGPSGSFSKLCPDYEYRKEQLDMAKAVSKAILYKEKLLIEAGTGVGKSVGYLIPAIVHSIKDKPVVVSTHTINLQSQLINKDIPLIQEVLKETPFKTVIMKGRSNYLCLHELDMAAGSLIFEADRSFKELQKWAQNTKNGDISDLDFAFPEWYEVCCNPDTCKKQDCKYYEQKCFYYKMKKEAAAADIIIANHSLFFSDLALRLTDSKNSILPDYGVVIFDEAHHLEDVATDIFGISFSNFRIPSLLRRIKRRKDIAISQGEFSFIEEKNDALFNEFNIIHKQEYFFDDLYEKRDPEKIIKCAEELSQLLDGLNTQLIEQDTSDNPDLKDRIDGFRRMLSSIRGDLSGLFFSQPPNYFKWCEKQTGKFVFCNLHLSPINVSHILAEQLWTHDEAIICTSATLSNSGTFSYVKNRLGLGFCNELMLGSPFDYESQALIYVPEDLDIPSESETYADKISERISELLDASNGRAFMLFTSYRMLNSVFNRLVDKVPYRILKQGEMSNERLIAEFKEHDDTCLMGVHSFWEGVDVKGDRLSCVIIDKLPFSVPDSPINKARCDQIEASGGNWFKDYSIPQAQIKLKQGFGRLIRTSKDRGVVAILDSRIHKKYYGKEFLKYLPKCRGTKKIEKVKEFLSANKEKTVNSSFE